MGLTQKSGLIFEPKHDLPYGYWTCKKCPADFYGGAEALHHSDCPVKDQGYKSCIYHFGPEEVAIVLDVGFSPYGRNLTLEKLLSMMPLIVTRIPLTERR